MSKLEYPAAADDDDDDDDDNEVGRFTSTCMLGRGPTALRQPPSLHVYTTVHRD